MAIAYAKSHKLPLAVRCGGRSSARSSSSENGLVVDLSKHLHGVEVDPVEKLGKVGGGAVWRHVDEAAMEYGLATVGGTVNHVSGSFSRDLFCCDC